MCYSISNMYRSWHAVVALGFLAGITAAGLPVEAGSAAGPPASPDLLLRQIYLVETRAESTLWEVWADKAELREAEGFSVLSRGAKPVEVIFHSGQGTLRCKADRATVDLKTKDVHLEGNVLAWTDQGAQLETEAVRWIASSRRLSTDRAVTVSRGGLTTQGIGMDAETTLERVRIKQKITSVLQPAGAAARARHKGTSP